MVRDRGYIRIYRILRDTGSGNRTVISLPVSYAPQLQKATSRHFIRAEIVSKTGITSAITLNT
jgi:hypothetical protein